MLQYPRDVNRRDRPGEIAPAGNSSLQNSSPMLRVNQALFALVLSHPFPELSLYSPLCGFELFAMSVVLHGDTDLRLRPGVAEGSKPTWIRI